MVGDLATMPSLEGDTIRSPLKGQLSPDKEKQVRGGALLPPPHPLTT